MHISAFAVVNNTAESSKIPNFCDFFTHLVKNKQTTTTTIKLAVIVGRKSKQTVAYIAHVIPNDDKDS